MVNENVIRKIDNLGRVVIPKHLRSKLGIAEGDELEIFTEERDGRVFICFAKVMTRDDRYEQARLLLEELGIACPEELLGP